jgi:hypothetical protein
VQDPVVLWARDEGTAILVRFVYEVELFIRSVLKL